MGIPHKTAKARVRSGDITILETYRAMDDDGLVRLCERPDDLTEEARIALASELSRRNIGDSQIRDKQSQWQIDREEDRQQVVASRRAYVHQRFESVLQLGVILGVAIAYMVLLSVIFQFTWPASNFLDKLIMGAAIAIWRLERAFVPSWKIKRTALLALAGYILVTVSVVWIGLAVGR